MLGALRAQEIQILSCPSPREDFRLPLPLPSTPGHKISSAHKSSARLLKLVPLEARSGEACGDRKKRAKHRESDFEIDADLEARVRALGL